MSAQGKSNGEGAKRLFGAWRYVGAKVDGKPISGPHGIIYYDPSGYMSVQVAPDVVRGKAGGVATPEEAKAAIDGYIAYFGTYSIDEQAQTVTHHRQASIQPGDVADLVRKFKIEGDKLTLNTVGTNYFVYWERMK